MRVKMTVTKNAEVVAEAIFEIASSDDLRVFSKASLREFRRFQPGIGLLDEDATVTWDKLD